MSSYCQPFRPADWYEPELQSSWHKVKRPRDDEWYYALLAEIIENAPANAQPVEAQDSLAEQFREQADKWERETRHVSSPTQKILHPSYQAILGMGREVVPLLLRDLLQNRREWFWALSYITQVNPINREDAGKMDKMIAAWVKWGKERGLL